jgi:catalase
MAVKFLLPDGRETDIVAISLPVFFVRDAEAFIDLTRSRRLNPRTKRPSPLRILGFLARHPEAAPAIWYSARRLNRVPASHLQVAYHALHAFRWIDAKANPRYVRYDLVPEAGEHELARKEARNRGRDFLREDLVARLKEGPARFKLVLQMADVTDPVKDATKAWPSGRPRIEAGTIELNRIGADPDAGCERRVFDPTRVIDGVECSDDPLLEARREAYSISIERRLAARG